jgi:hypothetical protein
LRGARIEDWAARACRPRGSGWHASGAARSWRIPGARAARYAGAAAADLSKIRTGAALSGLRRAGLGSDGATKRRSDEARGGRGPPNYRITVVRATVQAAAAWRFPGHRAGPQAEGGFHGLRRQVRFRQGRIQGFKDSRIRGPRPSVARPCHPPGGGVNWCTGYNPVPQSQLAHRMQSCATIPGDGALAERDGAGGPCCPRRHTGVWRAPRCRASPSRERVSFVHRFRDGGRRPPPRGARALRVAPQSFPRIRGRARGCWPVLDSGGFWRGMANSKCRKGRHGGVDGNVG